MALVTLTAEVASGFVPPRVKIDGFGFTGPTVTVYRVDPDGSRSVVRQGNPATVTLSDFSIYDYEAPFDVSVSYEVDDGGTVSASSTVTSDSGGRPWLVHPGQPTIKSTPLDVLDWPSWTRPITRGSFQGVNRREPIVVSQRRSAELGDLTVYTEGGSARSALLDAIDEGDALLLKGTSREGAGSRWVSIGDVEETPHELELSGFVSWLLPVQVVAEPSGFSLVAVSYADASGVFATYADALVQAPTYADRSGGEWL